MPADRSLLGRVAIGLCAWVVGGCAAGPVADAGAARVVIFGERHDQVDQQRQVAAFVAAEGRAGRLQVVLMEMLDAGPAGAVVRIPPDADEARVRQHLVWPEKAWPWANYGPVVMAAVRAGVPVAGANLPRASMRAAMADASHDDAVPAGVRGRIERDITEGHCGLLPVSALPGMVRVQVARDRAMAAAVRDWLGPGLSGRTVVLLAGANHASRDRGVPLHLAASGVAPGDVRVVLFSNGADVVDELVSDERRAALVTEGPDPCKALRERMAPKPGGG